jgi:O-acetyl-ADP-ribose deacetylase (regulator of RNase III)
MTQLLAIEADVTQLEVDAIVNSANTRLKHAGGVARAIAQAGGPVVTVMSDECVEAFGGPLPIGSVLATDAGNLPCKWVLHAVTMELGGKVTTDAVVKATIATMMTAEGMQDVESLAFVAFGAGIGEYPVDACARTMLDVVQFWLGTVTEGRSSLKTIMFAVQGKEALAAFRQAILYVPPVV